MTVEGVDYAFPPWPQPAGLWAAGKRFVVRYGGPGSSDKHLTRAELQQLLRAGLVVVANAEGAERGLLGGREAGRKWAVLANRDFADLGMPASRPIYFSVDFDVRSWEWPRVAEALRGAGDVLGSDRVGVYGGANAVRWASRDRVANWFWQTYAWSGGLWVEGCQLQQYRNHVSLAGGQVDLCRAMTSDYGQWPHQGRETMQLDGTQALQLYNTEHMLSGIRDLADPIRGLHPGEGQSLDIPNKLAQTLDTILTTVTAVQAGLEALESAPPVLMDPAAFVAALKADPAALAAFLSGIGDAIGDRLWQRVEEVIVEAAARKPPGI